MRETTEMWIQEGEMKSETETEEGGRAGETRRILRRKIGVFVPIC